MRSRTVVLLAFLLALGPAACARTATGDPQVASANDAKASASPSSSSSPDPDAPLKFAQCMRAHGLPWFPDPTNGRMQVNVPQGTDPKKMEAAQEACKQYAPDGGNAPKPSAEDLEQARKMAQCMRDNGVPNFPDPNPDGSIRIDGSKLGTGPGDPTFDRAQQICSKYMPAGGETHASGSDGAKG
jgi:hypothetical protein